MNNPKNMPQLPINDITGTRPKRIIFSIGHSDKSSDMFSERLLAHSIDRVVDVRSKPYSRRNPQYNKDQLAYSLAAIDINYDWRGGSLGGIGVNVGYQATLEWVYARAEHENIVLLCAEADYRKCHRHLTLTPDLERLGASIVHISY